MSCHTINIGQFQTGGYIGLYPTILIGTLYFENIGLLDTPETYRFEADKVKENIDCNTFDCWKTGVPSLIELSAKTEEAMIKQIEFVIGKTDCSFLVRSPNKKIRIAGFELALRLSALDRTIYQSKVVDFSDEEIQMLAKNKPAAIIIQLEKHETLSTDEALKQVNQIKTRLPVALHPILLLCIEFMEGTSMKASCEIGRHLRAMTGHPIVGSPIMAISNLEKIKLKGQSKYFLALASTIGFCTAYGFDLLFVGPLHHLANLSTAQGVVDIYNRSAIINYCSEDDLSDCHPIHELM